MRASSGAQDAQGEGRLQAKSLDSKTPKRVSLQQQPSPLSTDNETLMDKAKGQDKRNSGATAH